MLNAVLDPTELLVTERKITGMSAILLPFLDDSSVDWQSFDAHVTRTVDAGLIPAVNMDTGYANLIDEPTRQDVLRRTRAITDNFVAGAFVADTDGAPWNFDAYQRQMDQIHEFEGTPIIFQSYGLTQQAPQAIVDAYAQIGEIAHKFIAFELGTMFAPFGKIYDLDVYQGLLGIESCIGAKHSSLSRELEWQRLQLRNSTRRDFMVLTGNDLAIDMVKYGSDYLLGLSTFAPDLFAKRDAMWEKNDPAFYELNDLLQYLGFLAFRAPVPAYKHSAAQFLQLRGWITTSKTHPKSPARPDSDRSILEDIAARLGIL
ncbi:MAG: dihydrodipicolinate synthase family protein [Anaerolineae bacterium]